jgi:hypothetical protein
MALGAGRWDVLRLVIGQGLRLVGFGVALGVAGGTAVHRVIESELFGISPLDPLTFVSVTLFLVAVALLAIYLPAEKGYQYEGRDHGGLCYLGNRGRLDYGAGRRLHPCQFAHKKLCGN